MASLRAFCEVVAILWREWPDMLSRWLDRLTQDLDHLNGKSGDRG